MRSDIDRVIITPPRWGSSEPNEDVGIDRRLAKKYRNDPEALEDLPKKASMKPGNHKHYAERKMLSDFLAPLEGFLDKACGRDWDDVYSEIRANISTSKTLDMHILEHLDDMVEFGCKVNEDDSLEKISTGEIFRPWYRYGFWYTDEDNILRRYRSRKPKRRTPPVSTTWNNTLLIQQSEGWRAYRLNPTRAIETIPQVMSVERSGVGIRGVYDEYLETIRPIERIDLLIQPYRLKFWSTYGMYNALPYNPNSYWADGKRPIGKRERKYLIEQGLIKK